MDWSLLACGRYGHVTYAPDETSLHEHLSARTSAGTAWRCLRCGTFVTGEPGGRGPANQAPAVRRADQVRSSLILRFFAVERFLRAIVLGAAAYAVWRFEYRRNSIEQSFDREFPLVRTLFRQLGYDIDHSKLVGLIRHALILSNGSIRLLAGGLALYALIELIEAIGLWLGQRWGEYFAMVATSAFLPYEIYDLTQKVTVTRVIFFTINLALVLYLVITKHLFGVRGGKHGYEAKLRSESIMESAIARVSAAIGAGSERQADAAAAKAGASRGASSAAGSVPAPALAAPALAAAPAQPPTSQPPSQELPSQEPPAQPPAQPPPAGLRD